MEKKRLIVGIHLLEHDEAANSETVHCSSDLGFRKRRKNPVIEVQS
jgi:hypothetical protein